ncbi:hypothetical protein R0I01_00550 [Bacillus pumilus]|nr:hypothetical protein R0I01_00550 [Bacillus pumilus]
MRKNDRHSNAESLKDIYKKSLNNYGNTINKLATGKITEEFAQKQTKQTLDFEKSAIKNLQETG